MIYLKLFDVLLTFEYPICFYCLDGEQQVAVAATNSYITLHLKAKAVPFCKYSGKKRQVSAYSSSLS